MKTIQLALILGLMVHMGSSFLPLAPVLPVSAPRLCPAGQAFVTALGLCLSNEVAQSYLRFPTPFLGNTGKSYSVGGEAIGVGGNSAQG